MQAALTDLPPGDSALSPHNREVLASRIRKAGAEPRPRRAHKGGKRAGHPRLIVRPRPTPFSSISHGNQDRAGRWPPRRGGGHDADEWRRFWDVTGITDRRFCQAHRS